MGPTVYWVVLIFCSSLGAASQIEDIPHLDLPRPEQGYHGLVKENEHTVEVTPRIRATGAEICGFRIVNKHHGEAPFELQLVGKSGGEALLIAKKELNCEKRRTYKFDIAAVSCQGRLSPNVTVHVSVEDVNEYIPEFVEPSYVVQVEEGQLYDEVIQVEAQDDDCSPKFSDICKYEIISPDQPFIIDVDGKIKNTEPLDWEKSHNHILQVIAYDCGMKRSKPVMVTIKVNRVCRLSWKGAPERIEYVPGSGKKYLFPEAWLELCDVPCKVERVSAKITLTTQHIGKGCDRDTYSVQSQRKLCGASADSVDLLPTPGLGAEWTRNLPTDDGHESDQIYEFDGSSNAVVIEESVLHHNLTNKFTIATWMKHEQHSHNNSQIKEHILCNADDHKMSRPHLALFIRNCRLVLLMRREPVHGEKLDEFLPAEWRWKLSQVCDNQWHHFAVSVNYPEVILYVDGERFHDDKKNPNVMDDWPLHPAKDINTTLVIGACWQGRKNKMAHHFKGYLAGLSVLEGKTENPDVLACLHKCKESLEVPAVELLEPGMELLNNNELTEITVEGNNKTNLETLVRRVAYSNSRQFPTPGRRNLKLTTSVVCQTGKNVKVPALDSFVMVLQPARPTITLAGTSNLAYQYEEYQHGVRLFHNLTISVTRDSDYHDTHPEAVGGSVEQKVDSCSITVAPPLNPDHEFFMPPDNLLHQLGIAYKQNNDGIVISGSDLATNYEEILHTLHYFNRRPAYYLTRAFKLVCSELNGRFVSNEFIITLSVLHPQVEKKVDKPVAHVQMSPQHVEYVGARQLVGEASGYVESSKQGLGQNQIASTGAHTVTIIIVVCVGFLVFMIVLGVIRIRAAHQRTQDSREEDQEMAWDDSSLTITVNPMDQMEEEAEAQPLQEEDDSVSSEDGSSYHDDEDSEDEEEPIKTKTKDLEWDDSTLHF